MFAYKNCRLFKTIDYLVKELRICIATPWSLRIYKPLSP